MHQFGITLNDDTDTVWLDLNQNGIFEDLGSAGPEKLVEVTCCGQNVRTDVNLTAGESYNYFVGVVDTGGGSGLVTDFMQPGGVSAIVNPGAQPGVWSTTLTSGGGILNVAGGATLNVGAVTNGTISLDASGIFQASRLIDTNRVLLTGGFVGAETSLTLTGPGDSSAGYLSAGGASSFDVSNVDIQAGVTFEVDQLVISGGLTKVGAGTLNVLDQSFAPSGLLTVGGGTVNLRGAGTVGTVDPFTPAIAQTDTGGTLNVTGAISGNVALNGGVLKGTGAIGNLSSLTGGTLAPGDNLGKLSTLNATLDSAVTMRIELMDAANLDQLDVTGALTLGDASLAVVTLWPTAPAIGTLFFVGLNDGTDAIGGTFLNLPDGAQFAVGTGAAATSLRISYFGDAATNAFTGGNDLVLSVIPEPGSLTSLVGGLGMLLGLRRLRRRS